MGVWNDFLTLAPEALQIGQKPLMAERWQRGAPPAPDDVGIVTRPAPRGVPRIDDGGPRDRLEAEVLALSGRESRLG